MTAHSEQVANIEDRYLENYRVHSLVGENLQKVKIYEVVHIGSDKFYKTLYSNVAKDIDEGYTVAHEGFKLPALLSNKDLYSGLASSLGLKGQLDYFNKDLHNVVDMSWGMFNLREKAVLLSLMLSIKPVFKVVQYALEKEGVNGSLAEDFRRQISNNMMAETGGFMTKGVRKIIVSKRDNYLSSYIVSSKKDSSVVYGKGHAKGVIENLKNNGFTLISSQSIGSL